MIDPIDYGDGFYVNEPLIARGDHKRTRKDVDAASTTKDEEHEEELEEVKEDPAFLETT